MGLYTHAAAAAAMWADVAHEDDYVSDATDMRQIPGLGRTLVATRPIAAGTVLLSEFPLLMSVRELPRDTLQAVLDAETSAPHADTVKNAHAFLRAPEATQELFLRECCGEEGFEDAEHSFIIEMREGANWCVRHDPACAGVAEARLARALCIFAQNSFESDKRVGSAVHLHGSKWTHRCLRPNCDVAGNNRPDGRITCRAIRDVAAGEVLSISYVSSFRHLSTRCRREALLEIRGFWCECDDCHTDDMRCLPCPSCQPRDAHGLLQRTGDEGDLKRIGPPAPSSAGVVLSNAPSWQCERCGQQCTDAVVDTPCAAPAAHEAWAGSGGRPWPLPLPAGGLLTWESTIEDATLRMCAKSEEKREAGGWEVADEIGELEGLAALLDAVRAVLGERHWVQCTMFEIRVNSMLKLARELRNPSSAAPMSLAMSSRMLLTALGEGGGEVGAESGGRIAARFFGLVWSDLDAIWAQQESSREARWWARRLGPLLAQLRAWGCIDEFLSATDPAQVDERLHVVRSRAKLEDPASKSTKSLDQEHAMLRRALDAAVTRAAAGAAAKHETRGGRDESEDGMLRMMARRGGGALYSMLSWPTTWAFRDAGDGVGEAEPEGAGTARAKSLELTNPSEDV